MEHVLFPQCEKAAYVSSFHSTGSCAGRQITCLALCVSAYEGTGYTARGRRGRGACCGEEQGLATSSVNPLPFVNASCLCVHIATAWLLVAI